MTKGKREGSCHAALRDTACKVSHMVLGAREVAQGGVKAAVDGEKLSRRHAEVPLSNVAGRRHEANVGCESMGRREKWLCALRLHSRLTAFCNQQT